MSEEILAGLQHKINCDQPGYIVTNYVAVVEIQYLDDDGKVQSGLGLYTPDGQPDHITEILLIRGERMRDE